MNATITSVFLLVLVVACVECQQGEECPGVLNRRCREDEYCRQGLVSFLNTCVRYRGKGMRCDRVNRCTPGLECRRQRNGFFEESKCQDPSTTSTTTMPTSTSMSTSTFMPDSTVISTVSDSTATSTITDSTMTV